MAKDLFEAFRKNKTDGVATISSDIDYSTKVQQVVEKPDNDLSGYSEYMKYLIETPEELAIELGGEDTTQNTGNIIACASGTEEDTELTEMLKQTVSLTVIVVDEPNSKEELLDEELALLLLGYKLTNIRPLGSANMVTVDTNTESTFGDIELPIKFNGRVTIIYQGNKHIQRMVIMSLHRHYDEVERIGEKAIHDVFRTLTGFIMPYSTKHKNGKMLVMSWVPSIGTIIYDNGSNYLGDVTHKRRQLQNIIAENGKSFNFYSELCRVYAIGYVKITKRKNLEPL